MNDNTIPGELFVSMHRGIQDLDNQNDLKDLLLFLTHDDFDLDDDNSCTNHFSEYFYAVGLHDNFLLCCNSFGGSSCNPRDDENFLDYLARSDYLTDDDRYVRLTNESTDSEDFCDLITDANKVFEDAFKTLEPWLFGWRNDMMHVGIESG